MKLKLLRHSGTVVCVHPRIDPSLRAAANGMNFCAGSWKACTPARLNVSSQRDFPSPGAWHWGVNLGQLSFRALGQLRMSTDVNPTFPWLLFIYLVGFGNSLICTQHVGVESTVSRREVKVSLGAAGLRTSKDLGLPLSRSITSHLDPATFNDRNVVQYLELELKTPIARLNPSPAAESMLVPPVLGGNKPTIRTPDGGGGYVRTHDRVSVGASVRWSGGMYVRPLRALYM